MSIYKLYHLQHGPSGRVVEYTIQDLGDPGSILLRVLFLFSFHVEQSSFIHIVDMNRFFTGNPVSVWLVDYRKKS